MTENSSIPCVSTNFIMLAQYQYAVSENMSEHVGFAVSRKREVRVCSKESQCSFSHLSTVGSHSSKHAWTKGCSITETIQFV